MDEDSLNHPNNTVVTVISRSPKKADDSREGCLVVIYGDDLGRRVPLGTEPTVVGRSSRCTVQLDQESVSRNHARVQPHRKGFSIRDLGSTNGTYVNDELVDEVVLRDGDQIKIGRTIFKFIVSGNMEAQYHEEIYRLMTIDGLTELHNKRFFSESFEREASRAQRYGRSFSLVLFDIDHFKKINDTYGHLAGDAVLRQLGSLIRSQVRRDDVPARTGGEEFAVIVPEVGLDGAKQLAEKLRRSVECHTFHFEGTDIEVTISIGVAEWTAEHEDPTQLLKQADEKLYEAKHNGRNCIVG